MATRRKKTVMDKKIAKEGEWEAYPHTPRRRLPDFTVTLDIRHYFLFSTPFGRNVRAQLNIRPDDFLYLMVHYNRKLDAVLFQFERVPETDNIKTLQGYIIKSTRLIFSAKRFLNEFELGDKIQAGHYFVLEPYKFKGKDGWMIRLKNPII